MKNVVTFLLLILFFTTANSYSQQFSLQGDAATINATTFRLTPNTNNRKGMITNLYPKDLTQNFELDFEANFGSNNGFGADGIAVVFSKACNPNLIDGAGIGASGIGNSIIIEFDTYDNSIWFFDRIENHITIFKNGQMNSANHIMDSQLNPVCALPSCLPLDTNVWHLIKIKWEFISLTSQKVSVFINGNLRVTSTRNHIADSFQGNTKVFYSLSAATGAVTNLQRVKINDNSVIFDVCAGNPVTLLAPELGSNYVWSVGNATSFSNTFTPTNSGIVSCTYRDFCGIVRTINFTINLKPAIVIPTLTSNSPICNNEAAVFTITGTPGTVVAFLLNNITNSLSIPASGVLSITTTDFTENPLLKILQISNTDCAVQLNTQEEIIISSTPTTSPINTD